MARELRLIAPADGVEQLVALWLQSGTEGRATSDGNEPYRSPTEWALGNLYAVAVGVVFIEEAHRKQPAGNPFLEQISNGVAAKVKYVSGYLRAMLDMRAANSRRGANGRRLIGTTTREKARAAAEQFRGKHSRESAAPMVAELIGKSPATVRKLLSELFPGEAWRDQDCDESADVSWLDQR